MKEILQKLVDGSVVTPAEVEQAVGVIMDGEATVAQTAALMTALRCRGETAAELVAVVRSLRARSLKVQVEGPLLDTCGTGGDGLGTFNVSTAVSFVAAAAGVRVAKHGNRAASGSVGAADVLEELGAQIELSPQAAADVLARTGVTFLFAPTYHPAMRHVGPVRRELGFRTLFNLAGPLSNPAGATHQLLGLFSRDWLLPVAEALGELGTKRALVVHGDGGADELTLSGPSHAVFLEAGRTRELNISPRDYGLDHAPLDALVGGDRARNAAMVREAIAGEGGALTDVVVLNAGAALWVAEAAEDLAGGIAAAKAVIDKGAAIACLDDFVKATQDVSCAEASS